MTDLTGWSFEIQVVKSGEETCKEASVVHAMSNTRLALSSQWAEIVWLLCSSLQAWITAVQRCLSTANVSSSTCSSRCPVTTTSRPSPPSCCRRSTAPRLSPANRVCSPSIYLQVKKISCLSFNCKYFHTLPKGWSSCRSSWRSSLAFDTLLISPANINSNIGREWLTFLSEDGCVSYLWRKYLDTVPKAILSTEDIKGLD